jgi:hypothetical protein
VRAVRTNRAVTKIGPIRDAGIPTGTAEITVTVRDAGTEVKGATVHYKSHEKTTNANGRVTFTIAKGTHKGTKTITATKSTYYRGKGHFAVT